MEDPFEGVNWSEIRAEIATVAPIEKGATVTADDVYWTYRGEPQRGTVTRTYSRRFGTEMARIHWQDGSYSAVEVYRLTAVEGAA